MSLSELASAYCGLREDFNTLVSFLKPQPPKQLTAEWLRLKEASEFLGIAEQTIYQRPEIPRYKRNGRLYFKRSDLEDYLNNGKMEGGRK